jgi:hypothetical protein
VTFVVKECGGEESATIAGVFSVNLSSDACQGDREMGWFILFIILLGFVTVIGHGIWVLIRTVIHAIGGHSDEPANFSSKCSVCGTNLSVTSNFCGFCGSKQVTHESIPADLDFMVRQLNRMVSLGRIDQTTYKSIMQAIEEDRARFKPPQEQKVSQPPKVEIERSPVALEEPAPIATPKPMAATVQGRPVQGSEDHQPPRSFAEVLATFMEERSIQWGEVIGGLLIIGCSIALVVNLWSQITLFPLRQFLVFTGMTAGVFGLGLYSAHRWKLPTTSQGVLIIATLLVPLNFLAISAFSSQAFPTSMPIVAGELVALALFLFLVYMAARVILPRWEWLLICAVLGPSFTMMLTQHWMAPDGAMRQLMLLGILPLACYWVSMGSVLHRFKNDGGDGYPAQHFIMLGIASFAASLPLGLLIINEVSYTAGHYAPLFAFFGVPAIVTGLSVWRSPAVELSGGMRTAATSIGFIGALISLSALPIAWPGPGSLLIVALINGAICYALAFAFKPLKMFHASAIAHLLLGYLIAINLAAENILLRVEDGQRLLEALASPASARSLAFFFLTLAIVAEALRKAGKKEPGAGEAKMEAGVERYYAIAAAAVGAVSLALMTIHGLGRAGDPQHAAAIYAFYSIAAFIIAWRREAEIAGWIGSGLALLAVLQAMAFKFGAALPPYHPVRLSFLVSASVAVIAATLLRGERAQRLFRSPLTAAALFSSTIAAFGIPFGGWMTKTQMSAGMFWLALIWALLACFNRWPKLFAAFQAALTLSVVFGTAAVVEARFAPSSIIDPLMQQAQGIALALLSFAWILVRLGLRGAGLKNEPARPDSPAASKLLYPPWPAVDRLTIAISMLLLFSLSAAPLLPGAGELAMEAAGTGSWMLTLVLAIVLIAGLWVRFEQLAVLALLGLSSCVTMLAAGLWLPDGAEATAFCWFASSGFLIVSLPILLRKRVSHLCGYFGWPEMNGRSEGLAGVARSLAIILFVAPALLATLITFAGEVFGVSNRGVSDFIAIGATATLAIPLITISLTLLAHACGERSTGYAISSSVMLNLAVTLGSLLVDNLTGWPLLARIAHLNVLTTSVASLVWFVLGRLWLDPEPFRKGLIGRVPHQSLASLSLVLSVIVGLIHLGVMIVNPGALSETSWSGWIAIASLIGLMAACLWDGEYRYVFPGLFLTGLLIICMLLIGLDGEDLIMAGSILLASYGLALSNLWRRRGALAGLAESLNLPDRDRATAWGWLLFANNTITFSIIVISLISVFTFDSLFHRLIVATTALTLPISTGMLGTGERNARLITTSINLGLLSALIWSWAWVEPGAGARNYLVAIVAIMSAVVAGIKLWALRFNSFASEWRDSLRPEIPTIVGIGLTSLVVLFIIDLYDYFTLEVVMMGRTAVLIVLATLIVLSLVSLALALLPGEDPLGLDKPERERKKMGYVYAAEAFIALGLMHARITMPWLFERLFLPYWPLIIMALAFTGVALGELFRRRGRYILAEPLARTGIILPLLPVFGFWVAGSRVPFSGLLLLVGLFYCILSVMRHSFLIGLLAAVAGNGGLWHFFKDIEGYGFYQHPQLWLIPAALSVLAAARVNRESLTQDQMTGIRYASLMTIYISSTADIFINGVADSPWLSVILAALSVSGVIAGLILRVRAFLFLGTGFLLLAMLTMIWTASVSLGWDWLLYATGIVIGFFILYALAMFERKRARMLNLIDQLKQWKA